MTDGPWTVLRALKWMTEVFTQKGVLSARLDAELLLCKATGLTRIQLYTQYDQPLSPEERESLRALVKRRVLGEPVQHILGQQEFWSMPLVVSNAVLIPRADTEVLVEEVVRIAKTMEQPRRFVDVGTGSGAIALALATEFPESLVVGIDISAAALDIARTNVESRKMRDRVRLIRGSLLTPLIHNASQADVVVSNPPYIRTGELATLMPEVRNFEPTLALDGGADGLDVYRQLIPQAATVLVPHGLFAVEIGDAKQSDAVVRLLTEDGRFGEIGTRKDYGGRARVVTARRLPEVTDNVDV